MIATILDANAALEISFRRSNAGLLSEYLTKVDLVLAPSLYYAEVVNTLALYHRVEKLVYYRCTVLLLDSVDLVDQFISEVDIGESLLMHAIQRGVTGYDACYVSLAIEYQASVCTLDAKLRTALITAGVDVIPEIK